MEEKVRKIFHEKRFFPKKWQRLFTQKSKKFFSLRNTVKRIFMLFPELTKNQNPTESHRIQPNSTDSDQIRPSPIASDLIQRFPTVWLGRGSPSEGRDQTYERASEEMAKILTSKLEVGSWKTERYQYQKV